MTNDLYALWLSYFACLPPKKIFALLNLFHSFEHIWQASRQQLTEVPFLSDKNIQLMGQNKDIHIIKTYMEKLKAQNTAYVSFWHPLYPELLKTIDTPPAGLYIKGQLPENNKPHVSVIGSRRCSEYGQLTALQISKGLAANGVVIVSGLAKGIDSLAHKGALDGGGKTIAVLGCGVNVCYPKENENLMKKIIQNGCVISEYPPDTTPAPSYFPARNRIISGLSQATVVVEAGEKSGTLITVQQALEQGRDVYALPGNTTSKLSRGTNKLIQDGAHLITDYKDILYLLGITPNTKNEELEKNIISQLAPNEKIIYDCINLEPVSADQIITQISHMDTPEIQYHLSLLEIKGYIKRYPGNRFGKLQ